jgi:hypothetical protein
MDFGGRELPLKMTNHRYSAVAGDQQNFVVCRWAAALKCGGGNARHDLVGLRRGKARDRPKHAASSAFMIKIILKYLELPLGSHFTIAGNFNLYDAEDIVFELKLLYGLMKDIKELYFNVRKSYNSRIKIKLCRLYRFPRY